MLIELSDYCSTRNKIKLALSTKFFNKEIKIQSINNLSQKNIYGKNLMYIKKISCSNTKIYNINHLIDMEKLVCNSNSYIHQKSIKKLTTIKNLHCELNDKIKNVNHFSKLKFLNCCFNSNIDQSGISKIRKIRTITCINNNKINNINHLDKLKNLYYASGKIKTNKVIKLKITKYTNFSES